MIKHKTLPKIFVYLLTTVESLYQSSMSISVKNRKNIRLTDHSDAVLISCYLLGVLHLCETTNAKYQLSSQLFPDFLEYSRFTRRCNMLLPSIQLIRQTLVFQEVKGIKVTIIDSFHIQLAQPVRNLRSRVLGEYANIGYNATKNQHFYGCKCHTLVSESGYIIDYVITPASIADSTMTEEVLACFPTETVLGDKGYLGKSLQERLKNKGIKLITPLRKNMKQSKINFPNFAKRRKVIERVFSLLANLGAERPKSRSIHGFQLRLEMLILAYAMLLRCAKKVKPMTLRYSIGYKVMGD